MHLKPLSPPGLRQLIACGVDSLTALAAAAGAATAPPLENGSSERRILEESGDLDEGYLSPTEDTFSVFSDDQAGPKPYVHVSSNASFPMNSFSTAQHSLRLTGSHRNTLTCKNALPCMYELMSFCWQMK